MLDQIQEKLDSYKKRYWKRQFLVGSLTFFIAGIGSFLLLAFLEHLFWMSATARVIVFYLFLCFALTGFILLIIRPLYWYIFGYTQMNDANAAKEISKYFPEIEDRLINLLELKQSNHSENELISAAIDKKATSVNKVRFSQAVDFSKAKKYLAAFVAIIIMVFLVSFISPEMISESPKRIANYDIEYEKEMPFRFVLLSEDLQAFRGDDFKISFQIAGEVLSEKVYLVVNGKSRHLLKEVSGSYEYTFDRIQESKTVQLEASGFLSKKFKITTLDRPNLLSMGINIEEPVYTGGKKRTIANTGNFSIPEGSLVTWNLSTHATKSSDFVYEDDTLEFTRNNTDLFEFSKRVFHEGDYEILLQNDHSGNKSKLTYSINVIKDKYPLIKADFFPDTTGYNFIVVAGSISDDYGFSNLSINYRKSEESIFSRIPLEINQSSISQSFYANWNLDSLKLKSGEKIEVYLTVSDNDKVNGSKTSKSQSFLFVVPSEEEIDEMLEKKSSTVEKQLNQAKENSNKVSERLSDLEKRLKTEQKFEWQEKKLLEDILKEREKLTRQLNELQKQHQELQNSTTQFSKQSEEIQQKNKDLQALMNELMDEKTRELYDELQKMLKQNAQPDQISEQLKKLRNQEQNMEREMERALELFKRLKMESVLEQSLQKLDSIANRQEKAADTNDSKEKQNQQENVKENFDEFREKMDEVMDLNQELKKPEALEDFEYEERQISKELREIMEMMKEMSSGDPESNEKSENEEESNSKENKKGSENGESRQQQLKQKQQNAGSKMKSLSQKLSKMQGGMQMEMMQANLDQLRDILDNLIKLSFNQEEIMENMREVSQSDPRFLKLSQDQLKLKDDSQIIQDSLLSLASRVVQISSFVTREVSQIKERVDESIEHLKDRNRGKALTSQQFALTSINNLALLLDDTMQQMQMAMSESMQNGSPQQQQSQGIPDLQELQNQLGEKIQELKGSGKSGRELSEQLARLAAEQEMIRQQLEELKQAEEGRPGGGQAGDELQRAIDMMEQNEIDLVNKRLTEQLIFRQKDINTRLLEADKAKREQETDEKREAKSPSIISREIPPEFEEYLKIRKKEIELLKTIPLELNPFYKKEVNDYFRRISSEDPND